MDCRACVDVRVQSFFCVGPLPYPWREWKCSPVVAGGNWGVPMELIQ